MRGFGCAPETVEAGLLQTWQSAFVSDSFSATKILYAISETVLLIHRFFYMMTHCLNTVRAGIRGLKGILRKSLRALN